MTCSRAARCPYEFYVCVVATHHYDVGFIVRLMADINRDVSLHIRLFFSVCVCRSAFLSKYLSFCLSVYLSVCLSACMVCLSVHLCVCLFVHMSVCLPVCQFVCLSTCLSVYLSVCLFVWLTVCLSVWHGRHDIRPFGCHRYQWCTSSGRRPCCMKP